MHIGLDFDNTIVCYDAIVHQHAVAAELVPENTPVSKRAVRDYLQANGQGDIWTEMQGYIYGVAVKDASPFPQLHAFLSECTDREIHLSIVSHKTPKPHLGAPYDLHNAAREWLAQQGILRSVGGVVDDDSVFFEHTRKEKVERIAHRDIDLFVDDLPEVFKEAGFPKATQAILFDPNREHLDWKGSRVEGWGEVLEVECSL